MLAMDPVTHPPLAGQSLGPYTLESTIGHGGMGSVWLARRSDGRFEGQVAVKFLNVELMGCAGEERFRREGRVLAKLTHPNIARILDAGLTQMGQPYLVLEYVAGAAIDQYCDECRLDIGARVRLFLDVLSAVGHAHANLVVHRDIKPSNILVTPAGVVKLLDFGVAKLIEEDASGSPATLTQEGLRALTPEYAAPEQALSAPITVATDVYSLGVLLYVLLCGQHPTEPGNTSAQFIRALLLEKEPVLPSVAASVPGVARALRGDLDNILLKALKKNPLERYPSVREFAEDLRRYLRDEPVLARGDGAWYRICKSVARNRWIVGLVAIALVATVGGTATALLEARRAEVDRDRAFALSSRNAAVTDFLRMLIAEAASSRKPVTVRDMLQRSEALARKVYASDPQHRAAVLDILGVYYSSGVYFSSNDIYVASAADYQRGESLLQEALQASQGSRDSDLQLRLTCDHALTLQRLGKTDRAIEQLERVISLPGASIQQVVTCLDILGGSYVRRNDAENALRSEVLALRHLREIPSPPPGLESSILAGIGYAEWLNGRSDLAAQYYSQSMERLASTGRGSSLDAMGALFGWGTILVVAGNPKHGFELLDRASQIVVRHGVDPASQLILMFDRARALELSGRYREAREGYAQCANAGERRNSPGVRMECLIGLESVSLAERDGVAPGRYLATAISIAGVPLSVHSPGAVRLLNLRGRLALHRGRRAEARADFDAVIANTSISIEARRATLEALRSRAQLSFDAGDLAAAAADAQRAVELARRQQDGLPYSDQTGLGWLLLGEVLAKQGNAADAGGAFRAALGNLLNTVDPSHPMLLRAQQLAAGAAH